MVRTTLVLIIAALASGPASSVAGEARKAESGTGPDTALVHLGPKDGGTNAFVAWPTGKTAAQAILVAHEWWGLNAQIRSVALRLARQGYVAIVPDLYHGKVASDAETAHELTRGLDDEQALADFGHAIQWLRGQDRTRKARIGALGFCMGGRLVQELGMSELGVSAVVMFYGRPNTEPDRLARLGAPLQGHFGSDDQGIPEERVKAFEEALAKTGKDATIYMYPGAGHAFMNDTRESFRADAERQAWARTLSFFHTHLKR